MNLFARAVYGTIGTLALLLGIVALARPALALPPDAISPLTAHLIREEAAEALFIGLMAFWCLTHFEQRRPVHFALLLFGAVFAAIHWAEFAAARRGLASPLANTVPFVLLAACAPWRRPAMRGEA